MNKLQLREQKALTNILSTISEQHHWIQEGFWELSALHFGEPKDTGESEAAWVKRIMKFPSYQVKAFCMEIALTSLHRMKQLAVWREQHKDVPEDLLEDTVDLRILMEDDKVEDEVIHHRVLKLCDIHGLNYGDIVVQVQEAADRSY